MNVHTTLFYNSLILTGPTASGKSSLALELAEKLNAEIISADSMTVYRLMDIGTAKPSRRDRERIPHHLIDELDPWQSANVAWWLERASQVVKDIESRGKQALFVGGTPFYLKALLCGLFPSPPADHKLRRELELEAENSGKEALHKRLSSVDPMTASRLHYNDVRRVVRALEVFQLTGKPISEWQREEWWHSQNRRFREGNCIALDIPRPQLYAQINNRVQEMFDSGWVDEVQLLKQLPNPLSKEASQALGYEEIGDYLDGKRNLPDTIAEIQLRTRQFAKRQLTWFRALPGMNFCTSKLTFEFWKDKMRPG